MFLLLLLFIIFNSVVFGAHRTCSVSAIKAFAAGDASSCVEYWLNRYQTMAAAFVALIAAVITYVVIRMQTVSAERIAAQAVKKREDAASAMLPLALDRLSYYVLRCVEAIERCRPNTPGFTGSSFSPPQFPDEAVHILYQNVEASVGKQSQDVAFLLSELQIFRARIGDLKSFSDNAEVRLMDCTILHARLAKMFSHARQGFVHSELDTNLISVSSYALKLFDKPYNDYQTLLNKILADEFLDRSKLPNTKWN